MSLNELYDWFESHMDDGVPWVKSSIRHTLCVHQVRRHETTFDDHWLGVPLESIPELDGTLAFASHTSMATADELSFVDNPDTDFQLPPSVVSRRPIYIVL
ncbi:hypothetical protein CABS01_16968 [Colletotrichum abscissum]|uniref:uncharacterized protein n=1 Tax=Colletotrichum abscissum TaxID=1671311 RepID=UPI0027D6FD36|nr:uncharacterized protein CABS01_16968 [Colletotrichum abscissum]KAK1502259.1 hypothetical protein CABS01_16968 [Colletotrichum abscissum]